MYKSYTLAIKNKDLELLFKLFGENLETLVGESERILREWDDIADYNVIENEQLRLEYNKVWMDFIELFPKSLLCTEYKDEDKSISLSIKDIMRGEIVDGYGKETKDIVRAISEYVVYILIHNNNYVIQIAIWETLYLVAKKITLTSLTIRPKDVVKAVDTAYSKIIKSSDYKPIAYFCQGHLFNYKPKSSEQVGMYRQERLCEYLQAYLCKHQNPTKEDIRNHLISCCRKTSEKRLWLFRDGISDRTLNKVLCGYKNLVTRKKR